MPLYTLLSQCDNLIHLDSPKPDGKVSQYAFFYTLLLLTGLKLSSFPSLHTQTELADVEEQGWFCAMLLTIVTGFTASLKIHFCRDNA